MPSTTPKNNLTMYLAGGLCPDFYPWDLVLEEGFSRLYRAELTVISAAKHTMPELSGLLDKGITLTISQKLEDTAKQRTRYLHGIVTGVRSAGIFLSGRTGVNDCFSYVLTIEPELARLAYTRFTAPYYRTNPPDIFAAILAKYNISAMIVQDYINKAVYSNRLLFDQSDLPDLDFIKTIAALYGISFTFVHPAVANATSLGASSLYFSDGLRFPLSEVKYSDGRTEDAAVNFDFLSANEAANTWKMSVWNMSKNIGVDGVSLNALYPNANYGSNQWKLGNTAKGSRLVTYNRLFHGYDRQTPTVEIDNDIGLILNVRQRIAGQAKEAWTAGAPNLALRPALILKLKHFYGPNDDETFTALVTGISLRHRVLWPSDMAVRPEGSDNEITEITAGCIDWGDSAVKRYCPEEK
ncbi:MAG: phage late control D family protein [Treponema sp.]|jgi:hypothetical protein|nr:phage late control D family protein [Treponema sp.]